MFSIEFLCSSEGLDLKIIIYIKRVLRVARRVNIESEKELILYFELS